MLIKVLVSGLIEWWGKEQLWTIVGTASIFMEGT